MDLVDTLLESYQINPNSIPVSRAEIDKIDLDGKVQLYEGDFNNGLRKKIIGAVGYFRIEEYFEAAHSFERAVKAIRRDYDPEKRVVLAEMCAWSFELAKEFKKSPRSTRGMIEDISWAYSRQAEAYVDIIEKKRRSGQDVGDCLEKLKEVYKKAIELFNSVGINPFTDRRTMYLYQKLHHYVANQNKK